MASGSTGSWANDLADAFERQGYLYNVCYIVLIYFFCYFWTAITFNPKDMANNLKDYGSFIPGYRPGKRTADYLEQVMMRITYVGAAFLAVVAIIPSLISGGAGRRLPRRQLLRRHRPADRHQRRPRPGAEDQQPPGHAELPRADRGLTAGLGSRDRCSLHRLSRRLVCPLLTSLRSENDRENASRPGIVGVSDSPTGRLCV